MAMSRWKAWTNSSTDAGAMVYTLCIGSNEHRHANLAFARRRLAEAFPGIRFSREVDTEPLRLARRAIFANQVARFESALDLAEVVSCLKRIEQEAGSTRQERAGEIIRLDVDLLSCDGRVYKPEDWARDYVVRGVQELDRTFPPAIRKPSYAPVREPGCLQLSNGVPVYVFDAADSDVVRVDLLFGGGRWQQELPLQALFANRMLREGTVRFSSGEIAERLDYYGAWLELASAAEYTYLTLYSLGKYLSETLDVLDSVVKEPLYPDKELKVVLETNVRQFLVNSSKAEYVAGRALMNFLYGEGHPAGHVLREEDYRRMTPEVLRRFYTRYYHSANCAIYLSGRIDGRCLRLVEEHFGQAPFGNGFRPVEQRSFQPVANAGRSLFLERKGAVQNAVRMGMLSLNQRHPDYLKLRVLVTLFGGYFGSRLMTNIREQKGYTYGISAGLLPYPGESVLTISADTTPEYVQPLVREVYKELDRLRDERVSEEELDRVRGYMLGEMCRSYESVFSLADAWIFIRISGLDGSYFTGIPQAIETVTPVELQDLAQKHLCKENLKLVVCGEKAG